MTDGTTNEQFYGTLRCYGDVDEAEAVCGECGKPICGPIMDGTVRELSKSLFLEYGHGRRIKDLTFHDYDSGLGHTLLALGLFGVSLLLGIAFPTAVPSVVSRVSPQPIYLNTAIVHSAAILGVAFLLRLRYQGGEHKTDLRIRVKRTASRIICDECFENSLLQLGIYYGVSILAVVIVGVGIWAIATQLTALPLRLVALGIGILIVRDDVTAYLVELLEADVSMPSMTSSRKETSSDGD